MRIQEAMTGPVTGSGLEGLTTLSWGEATLSIALKLSYLPEDCNLRACTESDLRKLLKGLLICYWRFPRRGRHLYPESASHINF